MDTCSYYGNPRPKQIPIAEVTALVGYASGQTFRRAFRNRVLYKK